MINTNQKLYSLCYHGTLELSRNTSDQIKDEVEYKLKKAIVQQRHKHRVLSVIWHGKTFQND